MILRPNPIYRYNSRQLQIMKMRLHKGLHKLLGERIRGFSH